jgi:hypothetical protein
MAIVISFENILSLFLPAFFMYKIADSMIFLLTLNNREKIVELVKTMKPVSKYDAQEISRKVRVSLRDDPMFSRMKEFAFEKGLDLSGILVASGLVVRDAMIEELKLEK